MARYWIAFLLLLTTPFAAYGAQVIALPLPLTGRYNIVAEHLKQGAEAAVKNLNQKGHDLQIKIIDAPCKKEAVDSVSQQIKQSKAKIIIGPLCFDFAAQLVTALNPQNSNLPALPLITYNTRSPLLKYHRDVQELPLYSLSAPHDGEAQGASQLIAKHFAKRPFAIADDGSVYGRALAEQVRFYAQNLGVQPVLSTNFRPLQSNQVGLLRRLQNSGVEAVFIAASPADVLTIMQDMKKLKLDWPLATGERGKVLPLMPEVTQDNQTISPNLLIVSEEPSQTLRLKQLGLGQAAPDKNILAGYALVEIAAQALNNKQDFALNEQTFTVFEKELRFNDEGLATFFAFKTLKWNGKNFILQGDEPQ